jgi:L-lysine exporter family protein LysE/ArgO
MTSTLIAGFLSGAALIIAIGAQNSFVLRQGIRQEHVLPIVLVCASADALLITAGIAGLGTLIQSVPFVLKVTRYGGALFLMAYGLIAVRRALHPHNLTVDSGVGTSLAAAMVTCLAFTFLNPHVYLDTVILLGYGARLLGPLFSKVGAWRILDTLIAVVMFTLGISLLTANSP